jgi:hypothetical protein
VVTILAGKAIVLKGDNYGYICRGMRDIAGILKYVVFLVHNEQDERMIFESFSGVKYKLGGEFSC